MDRLKYLEWLAANPKGWSDATVHKYESATRVTSDEMLKNGVIAKPLYDMSKSELDSAIFLILQNDAFKKKDHVGNKMYSNGLKQYRSFVASLIADGQEDVLETQIESQIMQDESIRETERKAIISARIGQGVFRRQLIEKYGRCVITGVDNQKLLIASHIKPWSQSDNRERISVDNGLLLTPTFDKLFDYGLITFTNKGKLIVSSFVGSENERRMHIPKDEVFNLYSSVTMKQNMEYHADVLFVR